MRSFIEEEMADWGVSDNKQEKFDMNLLEEAEKNPKKKWQPKKVEYFYVWQEDILRGEFTEDWFDDVMEGSEDFANCKNEKENGIDSSGGLNYCKLPVELLIGDESEYEMNRNDYICITLATWIFTYSRTNHNLSFRKAKEKFPALDKQTVLDAIAEHGDKYLLSTVSFKDKFKRKKQQIVMDFDAYYNKLGYSRKDK